MKPICCICLQKTQLIKIACKHQLCESCRHQLLKETVKCPFCRQLTLNYKYNYTSSHIYCKKDVICSSFKDL